MDVSSVVALEKLLLFLGVFFGVSVVVIGAIMVDLWDGVYTARVTKQRVHSHKLRVTVNKMSEYWRFCIIGFLIDCIGLLFTWYGLPYLAIAFGAGLVGVEIKSMFEHSKKRKSYTTELPNILLDIMKAVTEKDAKAVIKRITDANTSPQATN